MMSEVSCARSAWTALIWRFSSAREAFGRRPGNHCTFQNVMVTAWAGDGEGGGEGVCAFEEVTKNAVSNNAGRILGSMTQNCSRRRVGGASAKFESKITLALRTTKRLQSSGYQSYRGLTICRSCSMAAASAFAGSS